MNNFRKRLRDACIYLSPIEPHVRVSIILAAALGLSILGGTGRILIDRTKKVSTYIKILTLVALAIILATLVLSSIPAHYPPRVTSRYIFSAVPVLVALADFIFATLRKLLAFVFAALISLFIFVSPATMFEPKVAWGKYSKTFSAILNRAIALEDEGYILYVSNVTGTERTMQNFFLLRDVSFFIILTRTSRIWVIWMHPLRGLPSCQTSTLMYSDHFLPSAPFVLINI